VTGGTTNALVVTQGDPEGVGPELLLHAAAGGKLRPGDIVLADLPWLARVAGRVEARSAGAAVWARAGLTELQRGAISVRDPRTGVVHAQPLDAYAALVAGARLVASEGRHALVTAPLDKAVAQRQGLCFAGHTEYLAECAGIPCAIMALVGPALRVSLVTVHVPLARVPSQVSVRAVARAGVALGLALQRGHGVAQPRVGVLGLNPHAGEGGLLGAEDHEVIAPAVAWLRSWGATHGVSFEGPLPADTAFHAHAEGRFHGLVAQYHDQGLAPFKLRHFHDGVNVTLGLPFVRTSPDHGTAKDIAGAGLVDPRSFFAAIDLARVAQPVTWREDELPA